MCAGPVLTFELITSARRTRFFLWRVAYASLLLMLLVLIYLSVFGFAGANTIVAASQYANAFFHTFAIVQLMAVLVLGPALAAGAIARERERRTIEYLFTTHLTDGEIVRHKFAASVLQLASAVLVGAPVLAVAMLLGGIAIETLAASWLITLSTIVLIVAVSLAASTIARRARDAVVATYLLLLAWLVGPLVTAMLLRGSGLSVWIDPALDLLSLLDPLAVMNEMLTGPAGVAGGLSTASDRWSALWTMVFCHAIVAAIALTFCWWALRRLGGERAVSRKSLARRLHRQRPVGDYAIAWREMHTRRSAHAWAKAGRAIMALLTVAAIAGMCWQFYLSLATAGQQFAWFQVGFATLLGFVAITLIAAWAASSIGAEREADTWITMLSTPVTPQEILAGKIAGSIYAARPVLIPLAVLWILGAIDDPRMLTGLPFTLVALAAASLAAATVGVGCSLWCSSSTRALAMTLGGGLGATVVGTCCVFPFGAINPLYVMGCPGVMNLALWEVDWNEPAAPFAGLMFGMYGLLWLAGMAAYLGLVWLAWAMLVSNFDRLAGRAIERTLIYVEDPHATAATPIQASSGLPPASVSCLDAGELPHAASGDAMATWKTE
jgi:ABC-type transport system involved in multi-copper enzyme maturation permease subunit